MDENQTPEVETPEASTPEVETTETSGRVRVPRDQFIEAWERGCAEKSGVGGVAKVLGLTEASVQQRATKYRNPPKKKKVPRKVDGKVVTVDGKVQYDTVDIPEAERATPVPLSFMPRSGRARFDGNAANETLAQIRAKIAAEQSEEAAPEKAGGEKEATAPAEGS